MSGDRQSKHSDNQQQRANAGHASSQAKALQAKGVLQQKGGEDLSVHDAEYLAGAPKSKQAKPVLQGRYNGINTGILISRRGSPVQMVTDDEYELVAWDDPGYDVASENKAIAETALCNADLATVNADIAAKDAILAEAKPAAFPTALIANRKDQAAVEAQYNDPGRWKGHNGGLTKGHWATGATLDALMDDATYHTSPNRDIYTDAAHRNDAFNPLMLPMGHLLKDGDNFHIPTMTDKEQTRRDADDVKVAAWQARQNAANAARAPLVARRDNLNARIAFLAQIKKDAPQVFWNKKLFT